MVSVTAKIRYKFSPSPSSQWQKIDCRHKTTLSGVRQAQGETLGEEKRQQQLLIMVGTQSIAIAIKQRDRDRENIEVTAQQAEDNLYANATWRLYHRIVAHREQNPLSYNSFDCEDSLSTQIPSKPLSRQVTLPSRATSIDHNMPDSALTMVFELDL
jgi:hypothetical protein